MPLHVNIAINKKFSINFKFHTDVNRFFCRILFVSVYLSFFFVNFSLFLLCAVN